jgi:hypothetical protein
MLKSIDNHKDTYYNKYYYLKNKNKKLGTSFKLKIKTIRTTFKNFTSHLTQKGTK